MKLVELMGKVVKTMSQRRTDGESCNKDYESKTTMPGMSMIHQKIEEDNKMTSVLDKCASKRNQEDGNDIIEK
jgi:hypothetical protein